VNGPAWQALVGDMCAGSPHFPIYAHAYTRSLGAAKLIRESVGQNCKTTQVVYSERGVAYIGCACG
jgi:hypothetical protein